LQPSGPDGGLALPTSGVIIHGTARGGGLGELRERKFVLWVPLESYEVASRIEAATRAPRWLLGPPRSPSFRGHVYGDRFEIVPEWGRRHAKPLLRGRIRARGARLSKLVVVVATPPSYYFSLLPLGLVLFTTWRTAPGPFWFCALCGLLSLVQRPTGQTTINAARADLLHVLHGDSRT
jgi:hypothetical protein